MSGHTRKENPMPPYEHTAVTRGAGADVRVVIHAHVLHELEEVSFHELEHEKKLVVLPDDFLQLHDVGVAQLFQRLHLSELHALFPAAAHEKIRTSAFGSKVTEGTSTS